MSGIVYPIDENGLLMLELSAPHDGIVDCRLFSRYADPSTLVNRTLPIMTLVGDAEVVKPKTDRFQISVPEGESGITLHINAEPFMTFRATDSRIEEFLPYRKLCVLETRMIGRSQQEAHNIPCGFIDDEMMLTALTDLHTHQSGQIHARNLIEIGLKYDVNYPTAALDKMGVDYPQDALTDIPLRIFLPLGNKNADGKVTETAVPLSRLTPEGIEKLTMAMDLSPESQRTYSDMEFCYYYREPFTKDERLFPDILRKIAEEYAAEGIRYAELSSNAIIDPKWLKIAHEVLPQIEANTGVQLRFLVGLPRNLSGEALVSRLEQIKQIAASPYIAGIDILGYEMNKTSSLEHRLDQFLNWASENQPDLVLRIHAGENGKNARNVRQSLELADKHGLRLRVGHAVYGVDGDTMFLAKRLSDEGKLIVEFNPDSNIAGNSVDSPTEIPIAFFIAKKIACTLSSDGAGIYRTNAKQTAMAGQCCGVNVMGFDFIRGVELAYIAHQQKVFDAKAQALPTDFFDQIVVPPAAAMRTEAVNQHASESEATVALQAMLSGRRPIMIAGGNGTSWNEIDDKSKEDIQQGMNLLVNSLDPEKAVFIIGRVKEHGVGTELLNAIADYNAYNTKKFDCVMVLVESEKALNFSPQGVSLLLKLDTPLLGLPDAMRKIMTAYGGIACFAGGRQFTRDFITIFNDSNIPFGLMQVDGASGQKGSIYPQALFSGSKGMLSCVYNIDPSLLTKMGKQQAASGLSYRGPGLCIY